MGLTSDTPSNLEKSINPDSLEIQREIALNEYHSNHSGESRSRLSRSNYKLYKKLGELGIRDKIPTHTELVLEKYGENLLDHYHKFYEGETIDQVRKKDLEFYHRLRVNGLLSKIPKKITSSKKD